MKIIVATLAAFLLGGSLVSTQAEARCCWNGYNHCRSATITTTATMAAITITATGIAEIEKRGG